MEKQVDKSHYSFSRYMHKKRWISQWHQLDTVLSTGSRSVLEIGPGIGLFKSSGEKFGLEIQTLDIDPELEPDHLGSVFELPFTDRQFDCVCAFQMLEHLPFEDSLLALREMVRVSSKSVIISLPDARKLFPFLIYVPKIGEIHCYLPRPRLRKPIHTFDGEHYWEINKRGFDLKSVIGRFNLISGITLERTFIVPENTYHRFFVFRRST